MTKLATSLLLVPLLCCCNRSPPATIAGSTASQTSQAPSGAAKRVEPISVDLVGWSVTRADEDTYLRLEYARQDDACKVALDRWWGLPPTTGGPMQIASRRPVTVDGRSLELLTTRIFQGAADQVDVLFVSDTDYQARLTFRGCPSAAVDEVLGHVHIARARQ